MTNGASAPDGENTGNTSNEGMESFFNTLPSDVQALSFAKQADSPENFWKRVIDNDSYRGASIRIPTENASAEDKAAFHQKLMNKVPELMIKPDMEDQDSITNFMQQIGMPADATGYSDVTGDEIGFAEGQLDEIKQLSATAGLTRDQYEALATAIGKAVYLQQGEVQAKHKQGMDALTEEWGLAAEAKYQQSLDFAKNAGAPESLVSMLENKTADAGTVKWLNGLANSVGESSTVTEQPAGSPMPMTPYEAQQQITEILSNKEHPYHKSEPRAKAKMHELMKQANPEKYAS